MKRMVFLTVVAAFLAGCTMDVRGPQNALIPEGEQVVASLAGGEKRVGELIKVDDQGIILREDGGLAAVNNSDLRSVDIVRYKISVRTDWKEKLFLYSRYPQGLTEEQQRELLEEAGQKDFLRPVTESGGTVPDKGR